MEKILGINKSTFINSPITTNKQRILNYHTIGQLRRFLNDQELVSFFDQSLDELKTELDSLRLTDSDFCISVLSSKLHLIKGIAASLGMELIYITVKEVEESAQAEQMDKVVKDISLLREAYEVTKLNKKLILQNE